MFFISFFRNLEANLLDQKQNIIYHNICFWIFLFLLLQKSIFAEDGEIRSSKNYQHYSFFVHSGLLKSNWVVLSSGFKETFSLFYIYWDKAVVQCVLHLPCMCQTCVWSHMVHSACQDCFLSIEPWVTMVLVTWVTRVLGRCGPKPKKNKANQKHHSIHFRYVSRQRWIIKEKNMSKEREWKRVRGVGDEIRKRGERDVSLLQKSNIPDGLSCYWIFNFCFNIPDCILVNPRRSLGYSTSFLIK